MEIRRIESDQLTSSKDDCSVRKLGNGNGTDSSNSSQMSIRRIDSGLDESDENSSYSGLGGRRKKRKSLTNIHGIKNLPLHLLNSSSIIEPIMEGEETVDKNGSGAPSRQRSAEKQAEIES